MDKERNKHGTTRQRVYDFLVEFITENCYAPCVREICVGTGLKSISGVYDYLLELKTMGKIEMKKNTSRAIKLVGYKFVKVEESGNEHT